MRQNIKTLICHWKVSDTSFLFFQLTAEVQLIYFCCVVDHAHSGIKYDFSMSFSVTFSEQIYLLSEND